MRVAMDDDDDDDDELGLSAYVFLIEAMAMAMAMVQRYAGLSLFIQIPPGAFPDSSNERSLFIQSLFWR